MKRLLALLLCLALATSLCACGSTPTASGSSSTPASASTSVDEGPTSMELALEAYQTAVDALNAMEEMTVELVIDQTMTVNGNEFDEAVRLTLDLKGIGTDAPQARAEGTSRWGTYLVYRGEAYDAGEMTGYIEDFYYKGPTDADIFLSMYPDPQLLTAGLYSSVEQAENGQLIFSGATAVEAWLAGEEAELTEASGTVTLDANGAIAKSSYSAVYTVGGVQYEVSVSAAISSESTEITPLSESAVYTEVYSPEAVLLVERAYANLVQAQDLSASIMQTYVVEVGAFALSIQENVDYHDIDDDPKALIDFSQQYVDYSSGATETYTQSEHFENGLYTLNAGGEESTDDSLSPTLIVQYCQGEVSDYLPAFDLITSCTLTVMNGLYLVEYDLSEEYGELMNQDISYTLWSDEQFLNDYASAYRTYKVSGYMGIDAATGLPTAIGLSYAGYHTIDGSEYLLSMDRSTSLFAASNTAYKTITGDLPEADPQSPSPLFYHVTGENGEELWLLGTIHVGDARTTALPQEIYDAFDAADALAVEFDDSAFMEQLENDPELANQVAESYCYIDGSTLADHLSDSELYENAVKYFKAAGQYAPTLEILKASMWSNTIDMFHLQQSYTLTADYGMDAQLMARAEAQDKEILNVESGLEQIQMLSNYSDEVQEMLLASSLSTTPYEYGLGVTELYEAWCTGDEAALIELLKDDTSDLTEEELVLYEEYNNAMVVDRNAAMLDVALDYLSSGDTVFYAVGLAHLITENGLVNTLRDAGYTVELVEYAE